MHRSQSVRRAKVTTDGDGLVSHVGTGLLAELADRSGLTEGLSVAMADCGIAWDTHDPASCSPTWHWPSPTEPTASRSWRCSGTRRRSSARWPTTPRPGGRWKR